MFQTTNQKINVLMLFVSRKAMVCKPPIARKPPAHSKPFFFRWARPISVTSAQSFSTQTCGAVPLTFDMKSPVPTSSLAVTQQFSL